MHKDFWADLIRTLVSSATCISNRVRMWKTVYPLVLDCFYLILFIVANNKDVYKISDDFEFGQI